MKELGRIVEAAETARAARNTPLSIQLSEKYSSISPQEISQLSDEELFDMMRLWRIWTVSLLSESQKTLNGKKSKDFLEQAKGVVDTYYYDPYAWEKAKETKTDHQGNEYEMAAEMCRDEGKLHFYFYTLTKNPQELELAIQSFDEAIGLSSNNSSVHNLATMEVELVKKRTNHRINFDRFRRAYHQVVEKGVRSNNWDRLAVTSWWYARASGQLGNKDEVVRGLGNFRYATRKGDLPTLPFFVKDALTPLVDSIRHMTL